MPTISNVLTLITQEYHPGSREREDRLTNFCAENMLFITGMYAVVWSGETLSTRMRGSGRPCSRSGTAPGAVALEGAEVDARERRLMSGGQVLGQVFSLIFDIQYENGAMVWTGMDWYGLTAQSLRQRTHERTRQLLIGFAERVELVGDAAYDGGVDGVEGREEVRVGGGDVRWGVDGGVQEDAARGVRSRTDRSRYRRMQRPKIKVR